MGGGSGGATFAPLRIGAIAWDALVARVRLPRARDAEDAAAGADGGRAGSGDGGGDGDDAEAVPRPLLSPVRHGAAASTPTQCPTVPLGAG
jgi:hypothetical protein